MLPLFDESTLAGYLLSAACSIHEQANRGLTEEGTARLRECAVIVARVAQQLDARRADANSTPQSEAQAVIEAESLFAQAEAARAKSGLGPPPVSARRLDPEALERYLRAHPSGGATLTLRETRLLPGGRCKLTALVSQHGASDLPETFILRQDWTGGATDTSVITEYELLRKLSGADIRAPRPLLLEADPAALGQPFILLERMPGSICGSLFTPPPSPELGLQLAEQMGRLHALSPEPFRGLVPENSLAADELRRGIEAFRTMQTSVGMRSELIGAAIEWLSGHLADAGSALCLTHNDLGFHNFLVHDGALSALLDWELAALGHPAADLGYVRPFIRTMLPWDEFVAAYAAAGGWAVELPALRFHTIWNAVRLYGLIMQARSALERRLVNDVEIAFACADSLMLLFEGLARELTDGGAVG
jgi:aminoglycoside phosphotransferase (APT) family kinase protein